MIRKYVLPLLALSGLVFAIYTVITSNRQAPAALPVVEPAQAPFSSYVAGAGIVEASTHNVAVGTPVAGRIRANVQVQDARQEQALVRYEKTVLTALEEVENALVAYAKAQARRPCSGHCRGGQSPRCGPGA